MKINPFFNALAAGIYILAIVGIIYALQSPNTPDSGILAPVLMLSLLTLSAAIMAFLFFYQPLKLYFDGERAHAVTYFMKTVAYFAVVVLASFLMLIYFRATNAITFPKGGEQLVRGQTYELTWTGGREKTMQIFLVDRSLKEQGTSVSISDRIYGIPNNHRYEYKVPVTAKPGEYEFQIGDMTSNPFVIVAQ